MYESSLFSADRVEQKRESRQRLTAVLRAEAEEDDLALTDRELDQCRFPGDLFRPQSPAGEQDLLGVGRVAGYYPDAHS